MLHTNSAKNQRWSDREVCERWHKLFKGAPLAHKYLRDELMENAELQALKSRIDQWRLNLNSISWFMKLLNEPIARQANSEDQCTRKFYRTRPCALPFGLSCGRSKTFPMFLWESRFKSQALFDEKALAACMAYVDLNPIRARMADKPETSDHTSVKKRTENLKAERSQPNSLMPFVGNPREPMPAGLPFHLNDYLDLVGRSFASCDHGIRASMHIIGPVE